MSIGSSPAGASATANTTVNEPVISSEVQRNTSGSAAQLRKISDLIETPQQSDANEGGEDDALQEEGQGAQEDNRLVVEEDEPIAEAAEEGETEPEPEAAAEEEPAPAEDASADRKGRLTPQEIAEKLGISVKQVYDLGVPFGGELVPLGKLKDAYQDMERSQSERASSEERLIARENELLTRETQMRDLVRDLAGSIEPEKAAKYKQQYEAYVHREQEAVFTAIPEWTDPAVLASDRKAIVKTLKGYGFNEGEIGALYDHRLVKLVRDHTRLTNRIAQLRKTKPKPKKASPKPGRQRVAEDTPVRQAVNQARRTGGRKDTIRAIGALLDGA